MATHNGTLSFQSETVTIDTFHICVHEYADLHVRMLTFWNKYFCFMIMCCCLLHNRRLVQYFLQYKLRMGPAEIHGVLFVQLQRAELIRDSSVMKLESVCAHQGQALMRMRTAPIVQSKMG
jgi:hypothetical protein